MGGVEVLDAPEVNAYDRWCGREVVERECARSCHGDGLRAGMSTYTLAFAAAALLDLMPSSAASEAVLVGVVEPELAYGNTVEASGGDGIAVAGADFAFILLDPGSVPPGAVIATGAIFVQLRVNTSV